MLMEIEEKLTEIVRQKLTEIPKENVVVSAEIARYPAVIISNLKFKLENADMSEKIDAGKVGLEEKFSGDGGKTSFKLQEKPLKNSVGMESPPGTPLVEVEDYTVNYDEGSIKIRKAPEKGKNNILVKYNSRKSVMTLKTVKVKALYSIDVLGGNRTEADSLAEKLVKGIFELEDELSEVGLEIRPLGGVTVNQEKFAKVQLKFIVERIMRIDQIIESMERIEITRKNI
jgi:hypothetical protein